MKVYLITDEKCVECPKWSKVLKKADVEVVEYDIEDVLMPEEIREFIESGVMQIKTPPIVLMRTENTIKEYVGPLKFLLDSIPYIENDIIADGGEDSLSEQEYTDMCVNTYKKPSRGYFPLLGNFKGRLYEHSREDMYEILNNDKNKVRVAWERFVCPPIPITLIDPKYLKETLVELPPFIAHTLLAYYEDNKMWHKASKVKKILSDLGILDDYSQYDPKVLKVK